MTEFDRALASASAEQIYEVIGKLVAQAIDDVWETATVFATITQGVSHTSGHYTRPTETTQRSFATNATFDALFGELHRRTREPSARGWNRARFVIDAEGVFNLVLEHSDTV